MTGILHFVSAMSLRGSFCVLAVLAVSPVLRRFCGSRAVYWLWPMVFLQLLCPWVPVSPVGVFRPVPALQPHAANAPSTARVTTSVTDGPAAPRAARPVRTQSALHVPWLPILWGAGAGGIFCFSLVRALRASRLVAQAVDITERDAVRTALQMFPTVPRRLQIRETDILRSPALCGLMHPVILLPAGLSEQASTSDLQCILSHELGHLQRGDLFWRWVFLVATAIHWFNPLVWLAGRMAREDQELACDELVLSRANALSPAEYAELLLSAASGLYSAKTVAGVTMAESKSGLARRLRQLPRLKPRSWKSVAGSLAIAATLILLAAPGQSSAPSNTIPGVTSGALPALPASPPPQMATASEDTIRIESKFVQIPNDAATEVFGENAVDADQAGSLALSGIYSRDQLANVIRALNGRNGIDLMSAPSVSFRSGQRASVQVVREMPYPSEFEPPAKTTGGMQTPPTPKNFATRSVGVTLEVQGTLMPHGQIQLVLNPSVVAFLGFVNYHADHPARKILGDGVEDAIKPVQSASGVINQPVFENRSAVTSIILKSGQTALLGCMEATTGSLFGTLDYDMQSATPPSVKQSSDRSLYILVTAKIIPKGQEPVDREKKAVSQNQTSLPEGLYAKVVPGKPGFVMSPYDPDAGYVDVRGYLRGTEVKCPYTGRTFLVP